MDFWSEETLRKLGHQDQCDFSFLIAPKFLFKLPVELVTKDFSEKKHQSCQISREFFLKPQYLNNRL
jgi:hypothetical protein